eukprot:2173584-Lingulodinium_polyedra.AAC.1
MKKILFWQGWASFPPEEPQVGGESTSPQSMPQGGLPLPQLRPARQNVQTCTCASKELQVVGRMDVWDSLNKQCKSTSNMGPWVPLGVLP